MGEFPSGQRGQTVNLLSLTSVVRIHLPPPKIPITRQGGRYFSLVGEGTYRSAFESTSAALKKCAGGTRGPQRKRYAVLLGRGGAAQRVTRAAHGARRDAQLVPTKRKLRQLRCRRGSTVVARLRFCCLVGEGARKKHVRIHLKQR